MRRISAVGAFAALLLSIGSVSAEEPASADDSSSTPWYQRIFGPSKPPPPPKKAKPAEKPPTPVEVAKQGGEEQQAYFKRQEFIDKLKQIAHNTHDDALMRKAEELDKLVWDIHVSQFNNQRAQMEKAKAAEVALEEKRNWGNSASASNSGAPVRRAPNGRPLINQE